MPFDHLTALMPCGSLDELSQLPPDQAEEMLSAWVGLWHPTVVAAAKAMPRAIAAASPPEPTAGYLFLLPPCAERLLPADWLSQAEQSGARILRGLHQRAEIVAAALQEILPSPPLPLSPSPNQSSPPTTAPDAGLTADFLALAFCHYAVEMLTQHMRYMSSLDESSFERELVDAAEAVCRGDAEAARDRLQAAFDLLHTAREYFSPSEGYLLDLTLVAASTVGASLRDELARQKPVNLLISGQVLEEMARREPATLEALRQALTAGTAAIVGGEFRELELPLLGPEAIRRELETGLAVYERHLGVRPTVFGRRRFGMTPVLPQILEKLGFVGALHATLDDGRFPTGDTSRIRWEGLDGSALDAVVRVPCDIGRPESFQRLPDALGHSMEMDQATLVFAHWPGRSSPWYDDLHRITGYTTVLGTFATATEYFQQTSMSGHQTTHGADEYRSPYLKQAVEAGRPDPISRWVRYFTRRAAAEAVETLAALSALVSGRAAAPVECGDLSPLSHAVDDSLAAEPAESLALDTRLETELRAATDCLARSISGKPAAAQDGILIANPLSFSRRLCLEVPELSVLPAVTEPVQSAAESAGRKTIVVDVPPLGFAWVGPAADPSASASAAKKRGLFQRRPPEPPPLAELVADATRRGDPAARPRAVLRNEFFELVIDPYTGAIRSIYDYRNRGPGFAQQIGMRLPGATDDADDGYSIMKADEVALRSPGPVLGEVVVRGSLVDRQARRLAGFQQTTRVWRGSRVIELEIELDVDEPPEADPWKSYYAARFAWADEAASLYRGVNQATVPTDAVQLESPYFIDVRSAKKWTTVLTGGLPYHRRLGLKKLDCLLVVRGETGRRFRLGIGIDVAQPMAAALDFLAPRTVQAGAARPAHPSGWLFHLDARGVVATHWEPLWSEGRVAGFRARLLETEGRHAGLGLRTFRAVRSAQKIAAGNRPPSDLAIEGDRITVDLGAYEWAEIEARFG